MDEVGGVDGVERGEDLGEVRARAGLAEGGGGVREDVVQRERRGLLREDGEARGRAGERGGEGAREVRVAHVREPLHLGVQLCELLAACVVG